MSETNESGFDALLSALREAHATSHDIRVGQLIYDALVSQTNGLPCPSLYYAEDGELAEKIRAFVRGDESSHAETREAGVPERGAAPLVCPDCNDTHWVDSERHGRMMCTHCPVPCERCRSGAYCRETPCRCECHQKEPRR